MKCDIKVADFDGCVIDITCEDPGSPVIVSLSTKCGPSLLNNGATEYLKAIYGADLLPTPVGTADFSVKVDLNGAGDKTAVIEQASLLKRNALAGPFVRFFEGVQAQKNPDLVQIDYRDDESIFLAPAGDRVLVIFSINFKEPDDITYGKVFLQEFSRLISGAPAVDAKFKEPPKEIQSVRHSPAEAYVTFGKQNTKRVARSRSCSVR
jgi:actin related protein 2/3 complex subunit 2